MIQLDFSWFRLQERHLAEVLMILLSHLCLSQHLFNVAFENRKTVALACLEVTTFIPATLMHISHIWHVCLLFLKERKRKTAKQVKVSARYSDGFKATAVSNDTCENVRVTAARAI